MGTLLNKASRFTLECFKIVRDVIVAAGTVSTSVASSTVNQGMFIALYRSNETIARRPPERNDLPARRSN
jgi:hypothetical protein